MQESSNNCFGSKKRSMTIRQAKTGKHELIFRTPAYMFSPDEGSCYVFSTPNNCCEFFASYGVTFHVLSNHSLKRRFWCSIVVYRFTFNHIIIRIFFVNFVRFQNIRRISVLLNKTILKMYKI